MISKEQASQNLKDFKAVLNEVGIPFYLDCGTLLGAIRDKGFCQDDQNDIDLTTKIEYWDKIDELIEVARRNGFALYHKWDREYYLKETGKKTSSQASFRKDGGKIDLMFKYKKGDFQWHTLFKGMEVVYQKVPLKFVEELGTCMFYGVEYNIPKMADEYLRCKYGDYNIKIHRSNYSCYTTDISRVDSYEEI